jgi:hypothetical protein
MFSFLHSLLNGNLLKKAPSAFGNEMGGEDIGFVMPNLENDCYGQAKNNLGQNTVAHSAVRVEQMLVNLANDGDHHAMNNLGEYAVANPDVIQLCVMAEKTDANITEKWSDFDIKGVKSSTQLIEIPIRKICSYFFIKRNEKIQNNKKTQKNKQNKKIQKNMSVFSIVGNENIKKRGRPPMSEQEKEQAREKKLERDRERLRQKRKILKTPEKLALRTKDKESKANLRSTLHTPEKKILSERAKKDMSKFRASLLTPDKKILKEQERKRKSEYRASLLSPDKKILKEQEKKRKSEYRASLLTPDKKMLKQYDKNRKSSLRATMLTPLKRMNREKSRIRMSKMRRSLNFIIKNIHKNKDKIAKKVKYESEKEKILARKRENYRIRVILDAISKMEKVGKIDKRILKALPGFNKTITEYLLDTQTKRQKAFTHYSSSISLLDAIFLSKISRNLKSLYLKGDMEIHKLLDILFLANNEYIRNNPKTTDYEIFLQIYENVIKVYGKAYRGPLVWIKYITTIL